MNLFQKVGAVVLILVAFMIGLYTLMYALDIYPANCVLLMGPVYDRCASINKVGIEFTGGVFVRKVQSPFTINFVVRVPYTPPEDTVYLETADKSYMMYKVEDNIWKVNITRFTSMKYRYNRNGLGYTSAERFEPDSELSFRTANFESKEKTQEDEVVQWRWFSERELVNVPSEAFATDVKKRDFQKGIALLDYWWPGFGKLMINTAEHIGNDNAEWVMITSQNDFESIKDIVKIRENSEEYKQELKERIINAKNSGLKVMLKLKLCCNNPARDKYSAEWWGSWFNETSRLIDEYSKIAEEAQADSLLIDYSYGNSIPDELYSPRNAKDRWNAIIKNIRSVYSGKIGFNFYLGGMYRDVTLFWPENAKMFSQDVDFYGVEVWTGLAFSKDASQDELNKNAEKIVDNLGNFALRLNKPFIITGAVYTTVDGCSLGVNNITTSISGISPWDSPNPDLVFDSKEQAMVYEAYLHALALDDRLDGFYSYGYWPVDLSDSNDYSIRSKEAEVVVRDWYSKF